MSLWQSCAALHHQKVRMYQWERVFSSTTSNCIFWDTRWGPLSIFTISVEISPWCIYKTDRIGLFHSPTHLSSSVTAKHWWLEDGARLHGGQPSALGCLGCALFLSSDLYFTSHSSFLSLQSVFLTLTYLQWWRCAADISFGLLIDWLID